MENEFYDRIVYKKNAFNQMSQDLSVYFTGKKILLITTKSLINSHLTEIMNAVSTAKCSFSHFIAKNNFSESELRSLVNLMSDKNFDLFIVFGGVRATMVTKYFANIFCLPYFVCPSIPSGIGYFSNLCINPYDSTRSFVCDYPTKIYISEAVIKSAPKKYVKQGIFFLMSYEELLAIGDIENILLGKRNNYDDISSVLKKLKCELKYIMTMDSDAKLKLMDIIIDMAYYVSKLNFDISSVFNLYCIMQKVIQKQNQNIYGGEGYLLASKTLLTMYQNFFKQKSIKRLDVPNVPKIVKNIKKYTIFQKNINNLSFFNEIFAKKDILIRINNLKEEFYFQCNNHIQEQNKMLDVIKSYDKFFLTEQLTIKDIFTSINIFPFVTQNNFIVNLMSGMGFVNNF